MSYLLDALRKADQERGGSAAPPASLAVHYEAPEKRSNWWWLIASLLLVNIVAAGYLLFGDSVSDGTQIVALGQRPTALIASSEPAAIAKPSPTVTTETVAPVEPVAAPEIVPTMEPTAQPIPMADPTQQPLPIPAAPVAGPQSALVPALPPVRLITTATPEPAARASAPVPRRLAATKKPVLPVTKAPQPDPVPVTPINALPQLPFLSQLPEALRSELPRMNIRAIVDHAVPAKRFVLINAGKYREGDAMAPGLALEQITAQGVVMDYKGNRFILLVN